MGHVGAGRWLRLYAGATDVRYFGATGTGLLHDDTVMIQGALNLGGAVHFPPPPTFYAISANLTRATT